MLDDMYVEIITDGIHLPKELLQLIYKLKGSDRIALITDAMRGSGMPDGISILGSRKNGQEVLLEDGVAKLMDKTAFAGSIATCDRLARTMTGLAGVSIEETVKMMSEIPAKIMGIYNERGSLDAGKYADIVVFGDNVDIELTMVEGDVVYKKIENGVETELLSVALKKLNEREREIMELRYGLRGGEEKTQKQVADMLGISQSYISRLEKKIIGRLKKEFAKMV